MGTASKAGVYVHIPFCVSKCAYCDFLSFADKEDLHVPYVKALINEIERCERLDGLKLESIFFGGGTPGILNEAALAAILSAITAKVDASSAEITIETNPGIQQYEKYSVLRAAGFNRISFGLQAAQDQILAKIGRSHINADFLNSYEAAVSAGFSNINTDIMFALPGQTSGDLSETLAQLIRLQVPHISAYSLIVEEMTEFGKLLRKGELELPNEEVERELYEQTCRVLAQSGYAKYEISNFAKPGYECRHNILYWTRQNYVGFGLGAHSLVNNVRWRNTYDIHEYIATNANSAQIIRDVENLDITAQMEEYLFLGLRMTVGVVAEDFQRYFGQGIYERFGEQFRKYEKLGLLERNGGNVRLTPEGISVSNVILADFLS